MEWGIISSNKDGGIDIPETWLFTHYFEALNTLFRIENSLRVFVYVVLKNVFKDKWDGINLTSDDGAETAVGKIAKQRMNQTKSFGYLEHLIPCPLMYMTSGELIRLITSEAYWPNFNGYFLGSKEIIKNKLEEIGAVRNALAHFRPIKKDDVELIKQNAKHVLSKIEKSLVDMIKCNNIVPTNTQDDWYKNFKLLDFDNFRVSFNQSNDEEWVKISFEYSCPILKKYGSEGYRNYSVLNLHTSYILRCYTDLKCFIIFLSESYIRPRIVNDDLVLKKLFTMIFSRKVLFENHEKIKGKFEKLLTKISEETELLMNDNLAKGEIVRTGSVRAHLRESKTDGSKFWTFNYESLNCEVKEEDPPEYWGRMGWVEENYVTSTDKYPWMPVTVSKPEIPF